ncbi:response regulator [Pseudomonas cavernicola]|uniref:Response regulator n=1 Tax=Pseudomonas cavernicola TaxID=2320866 RepID=A0A418XJZ1_9PSED|nr:response regulator [Pseudomonas cavernicola]RJG12746.1 response regulator [Pseudomonas cavernicola]
MHSPLRILVVEDHSFQLIAAQMVLNQLGYYHLAQALDAEEALQAMQNAATPFDLLLCDQNLPDMPGLKLIERACASGKVRAAVLFSGVNDAELAALASEAESKALPLLACLSKPIDGRKLTPLIAQHFPDREAGLAQA